MGHSPLTEYLINRGVLDNEQLITAFDAVDRRDFLPPQHKDDYLQDRPLPIGYDQTNSQPFTVAFMLELILPAPGEKVLDVGSGSGWTAALIGSVGCDVIGVELIPELVELAKNNLSKYKLPNVNVVEAQKELGWPSGAPYDKILVSAATNKEPKALLDQLMVGGRMVIPIGESIFSIDKTPDGLVRHEFPGFRFVPLVA